MIFSFHLHFKESTICTKRHCKQLDCTDDKIVQIAETSGFNSAQAFIRVFTKIKGISPSKYRKERNR